MVGEPCPDAHRADFEIQVLEFFDFDVAGQFSERQEIGAFHLAGQNVYEPAASVLKTKDAHPAMRQIDRRKKRQPLNVIPVRVGQQQGEIERLVF